MGKHKQERHKLDKHKEKHEKENKHRDQSRDKNKDKENGKLRKDSSKDKETPRKETNSTNKVQQAKKYQYAPFNELMKNVTFVISGFQNPLRGEVRSKACKMGAVYKGDWDASCTHLICAFANTPKFNQVKGKGKIVKKEWVEDNFTNRKKLNWKRYSLTKAADEISDEEIHE